MRELVHRGNADPRTGSPKTLTAFVRHVWKARDKGFPMPSGLADDLPPVRVEVEHGRWITRCPWCPGAEMADPEDPRFYCLSCANERAANRWLTVAWPDDRDAIAVELLKRPLANRNWRPGEPVDDLRAENLTHLGGK